MNEFILDSNKQKMHIVIFRCQRVKFYLFEKLVEGKKDC